MVWRESFWQVFLQINQLTYDLASVSNVLFWLIPNCQRFFSYLWRHTKSGVSSPARPAIWGLPQPNQWTNRVWIPTLVSIYITPKSVREGIIRPRHTPGVYTTPVAFTSAIALDWLICIVEVSDSQKLSINDAFQYVAVPPIRPKRGYERCKNTTIFVE